MAYLVSLVRTNVVRDLFYHGPGPFAARPLRHGKFLLIEELPLPSDNQLRLVVDPNTKVIRLAKGNKVRPREYRTVGAAIAAALLTRS